MRKGLLLFRQTWFLILFTIVITISMPFIIWFFLPNHPLDVWILDKTVTKSSVREHKGLMWLLNHQKIVNIQTGLPFNYKSDHYGVISSTDGTLEPRLLPQKEDTPPPRMIYIADTYGQGSSSSYDSGLHAEDTNPILTHLKEGTTLIAEFISLASPTKSAMRIQLEQAMGVDLLGWTGRYYIDLSREAEVSDQVIKLYERSEKKAWLFQGPRFILTSDDDRILVLEQQKDLGDKLLTFAYAVDVVHGNIYLPVEPGHAGGDYRTDISRYLLGWIIGTKWYPYAVKATNDLHPGTPPFAGTYFGATAQASPFESWLASMFEIAAAQEMKYGWQHPISFTNWLSTDPLRHPNEPLTHEDLVSVDPMHIRPTAAWSSGYFASYHVYPYYPDFLRFEAKYQTYRDTRGELNPYAGYLHDLRQHHSGIPLIVAEFGVPSSRGIAHYGSAGRHQGMHTEEEQGKMDADMIRSMYDEHYDGAMLFEWQDEWFKYTWNTIDYEIPELRRALWRNRLTNEENFGVIAVEPGKSSYNTIILDGLLEDWGHRLSKKVQSYGAFDLATSHDEAYLYLMLRKKHSSWQLEQEPVTIGFDSLPGGANMADHMPGILFERGVEFLLTLRGNNDSRMLVNSVYDQHTWLYGATKKMLPAQPNPSYAYAELGLFLPWKLALNKPLFLPQSNIHTPFEKYEVGIFHKGRSDPTASDFNTLSDWYVKEDVLEIRIPWMLLGYTDPSSHLVWDYPYQAGGIIPVRSEGIWIEPYIGTAGSTVPTPKQEYSIPPCSTHGINGMNLFITNDKR